MFVKFCLTADILENIYLNGFSDDVYSSKMMCGRITVTAAAATTTKQTQC